MNYITMFFKQYDLTTQHSTQDTTNANTSLIYLFLVVRLAIGEAFADFGGDCVPFPLVLAGLAGEGTGTLAPAFFDATGEAVLPAFPLVLAGLAGEGTAAASATGEATLTAFPLVLAGLAGEGTGAALAVFLVFAVTW